MRALTTTRGLGCVQIGRIVNGQLGILGQDGVLGNDGRFHALPAELVQPWDCVTLDAHGQTFINIVRNDYASGPVLQRSCIALPQSSSERRCPAKDQRMLTYGLLGPKAASLTYLSGGRQVTTAPVGRQGAYLFVLSAGKTPQATGIISAGGGTGSSIDFPGLLKVTYKDGHTCRRAGPAPGSGRVCGPAGYVQTARTPRFSHVRVRSTIRRYLRGNGKSYADLRVMFRAPAAVTDANSGYTLAAKFPAPCNGIAGTNLARNVIRGEPITLDLQGLPGNCPGVAIAHLAFTGPGGSISILGGPAGPRQPLAGNTLLPGPEVASIATFKFRVPKTTGASESGGPIPRNRLPAWAK